MKAMHYLLTLTLAVALPILSSAKTIFFGPDGFVKVRSAALAELVPYSASNASLTLQEEKTEYLGDGSYSITRTILNKGRDTIRFKDELRVRDCFTATRFLIPCVNYTA